MLVCLFMCVCVCVCKRERKGGDVYSHSNEGSRHLVSLVQAMLSLRLPSVDTQERVRKGKDIIAAPSMTS